MPPSYVLLYIYMRKYRNHKHKITRKSFLLSRLKSIKKEEAKIP